MGKKEAVFVLEDKFHKDLMKAVTKHSIFLPYNFTWRGKRILAQYALMNHCIGQAEQEIQSSKEYRDKIIKRVAQIARQYRWVKDKKKYSRCGKWLKNLKEKK